MWLGGSSGVFLAVGEAAVEELSRGVLSGQRTATLRYNQRVAVWLAGMSMRLQTNSQTAEFSTD
jgi:hypothetical protein